MSRSKSPINNSAVTPKPLTDDKVRLDMIAAFKGVKLDTYTDILRIKKPHSSAYLPGQMLCKLVNIFRGVKTDKPELFEEWREI